MAISYILIVVIGVKCNKYQFNKTEMSLLEKSVLLILDQQTRVIWDWPTAALQKRGCFVI